jgi:hypothetical protein
MHTILHPGQSEIYSDLFIEMNCRYAVAVCSRGWGKSYFAAACATTAIFELLQLATYVPNKIVYIIAPTYAQVTDIYYPLLAYEMGLENYCIRSSKDAGRFWFPKGVELRLVSYEAVERLRGTGAYFVVMDEVRDWTKGSGFKEAWESIIQPCINTRWSRKRAKQLFAKSPGRALCISTPKGYDYLYEMYHFEESDSDWKSYHFDYRSSPYLDEAEIEKVMHTIDPLKFAREYKASFEDSGNNVFYCFNRKVHVQKDVPDLVEGEDVHIGIDFNVGLQCSSVFVIRGNQVHFIDELKGHPDTEQLAIAIKARYKGHKIFAYPDPSGRSRKTSAPVGVTDFSILRSYGIICLAHKKAPPIVDSVAAVNKMLKTAAGGVSIYIHPRCVGVIQSLERTAWVDNNADTATIDKKEGNEHFSDGIRYAIEFLFPIKAHKKTVERGFGF